MFDWFWRLFETETEQEKKQKCGFVKVLNQLKYHPLIK
jgi:hypothetical protein